MSISSAPMLALQSEYSEQGVTRVSISNASPSLLHLRQNRNSLQGHVVILWDIENCRVPSDVRPEDVAGNIRMALRVHPVIDGAVTMFSAYGDFNAFPRRLREGCQRTGVKLIDVPNGRKDAADKAILVDMFLFALDNPPPSSIMLISGDVDFAPALHILGQRGYTIILVIPSGVGVPSALSNAGRFVWDWPSVARGEGFVPPKKRLVTPRAEVTNFLMGCQINDYVDGQKEEESIVYRGISKSCYNSRDFSLMPQCLSEYCSSSVLTPRYPTTSKSCSLPNGLNDITIRTLTSCGQNDLTLVQPGDLNGLKGQLVKLLELAGGGFPLTRLPSEYHKFYGRPLYASEYRTMKFLSLLKKMADVIAIEGKGLKKFVCLRNSKCGPVGSSPLILTRRDNKKGEGVQEDNNNGVMAAAGSSDEFSDDERVILGENDDAVEREKSNLGTNGPCRFIDQIIFDKFKHELQEVLVSYSCRIFLSNFEEIYRQRYKRPIDYETFGVNHLEELLQKMGGVVLLQEEPATKRKFLVAVDG